MPKLISPLTDIRLRNAKPAEKPYKLSDGGAMYVEVMSNGSKFWRMKVRQADGKESRTKPASNGAILMALRRMSYQGRHAGHGFRSLAMGVIKARLGYRHEVVDRQLAHGSNDEYGEAYDREQFQDERKVMMQAYADYLDTVEGGANVIPVRFRRA